MYYCFYVSLADRSFLFIHVLRDHNGNKPAELFRVTPTIAP